MYENIILASTTGDVRGETGSLRLYHRLGTFLPKIVSFLLCRFCLIVITVICVPFYVAESQRPANKRRKRKGSNSGGAANNAPPAPNKKRSPGPNFSLASQVICSRKKFMFKINAME